MPQLTEIRNEILDAWNMTTYRYKTTRILYDYVTSESNKTSLLNEAKLLINQATSVVRQREQKYRAPHLYDWGSNPTAYNFGYLWTVHSLYYFWRDYYQAIGHLKIKGHNVDVWSPCFLNIQDPHYLWLQPKVAHYYTMRF